MKRIISADSGITVNSIQNQAAQLKERLDAISTEMTQLVTEARAKYLDYNLSDEDVEAIIDDNILPIQSVVKSILFDVESMIKWG